MLAKILFAIKTAYCRHTSNPGKQAFEFYNLILLIMVLMEFNSKEVWEYRKESNIHLVRIFKRKNNILVIESMGIAYFEGCEKVFEYIIDYAKRKNEPVSLLLDNSKLQMINESAKMLFLRFQEANHNIKKIATVGNNSFLQQFGKIYQHTCYLKYTIKSFKNKNMAMIWLNNGEHN